MMIKSSIFIFILHFVIHNECKVHKKGSLRENEINTNWKGLWFPKPPNYYDDSIETANVASAANTNKDSWQGPWFPHPPGKSSDVFTEKSDDFAYANKCDNGKQNIAIDFDPEDKRHSYNFLCFGNRTEYEPNFNTSSLLIEHFVPAAYQPPVKCISERIDYNETLPTFGPYRPLAPKFGAYKYLPPQRWLRSLADGAIVFLYHPCAFSGQIKQLQNTLQGCLYRHIISPSLLLTAERPLALLAWGKCLQMSVVDDSRAVQFIKDNAKLGIKGKQQKLNLSAHLYDAGLLTESHLVTDEQDSEVCGYKEM
ncbi:uncharacterized protein LOC106081681 [Stomoxys calcitrans]|uniref:uncharacterized protein LOC106081681 n=1 Tax=Stomoxys calcitrans TaxID=35570 RepID=UPI0027E25777|nr:uncharacterized protein LOC106081681 [Stomoxys calcitrans]